ncbi:hypothetical protein OESDEN_03240 [Oesophagostomum dentatum]|uniref:snRNA-activating protein complex subunit 3 n=1 Tax=Oesophagostomum dentatum TaxID=61180 RepID=A0A0B1TL21_OESDE|nr:hypothetical protein OESDEN_03240 [Oesophagostomum dentatum]
MIWIFLEKGLQARNSLIAFFGGSPGDKDAWRSGFVPWLKQKTTIGDDSANNLKFFIDKITDGYRDAARQYCYDKDAGRGQKALNKRSQLRCMRIFLEKGLQARSSLIAFFGGSPGDKDVWQSKFVPWLQQKTAIGDDSANSLKFFIDKITDGYRDAARQYCYDKDAGRGQKALNKRSHLRCMRILEELNAKRKNPQYKSISLRSMIYDKYDANVFVHCIRKRSPKLAETIENLEPGWNQCPDISTLVPYPPALCEEDWYPCAGNNARNMDMIGPEEAAPFDSLWKCSWDLDEIPMHHGSSEAEIDLSGLSLESPIEISEELEEDEERDMTTATAQPSLSVSNSNDMVLNEGNAPEYAFLEPAPQAQMKFPQEAEMCPSFFSEAVAKQSLTEEFAKSVQDDIVVEIAIFIGYPRPLEKHEIRLGRLMKVLDRFLVLGSNTLKDLKDVIDCTYDYQVIEDISGRSVKKEDLSRNRFPSSFFFIHDTFYIDLEPEGAKDITAVVDLTCRFGAPYLYNHVGACEHLIVITRAALRDASHPKGPYPVPIYERNFRRIACGGCKEETAEWVVWEHECMPSFTTFLCDSCYKEFNFEKGTGRRIFNFKAAPCYDRRNRRAGPVELHNLDCFKESASVGADLT